jgi:dolichol-phosphate mannosyltransferase
LSSRSTFAISIVFFTRALFFATEVVGWASLFVTMLFVGSIHTAMMGILGIYIGKTFEETKGRPLYVVKDTVNFRIRLECQDGNRLDVQ